MFLPHYCFWGTGSLDLYMSRVVIVQVLLDLRSVLVSWISCVPLVLWCWVLVFLFAERLFFFLLVLCFCFAKGRSIFSWASELFSGIGNTLPRCTVLANIKVFKSIAFSYNYNFLEVKLFIWFSIFCRICCQFRKHACFRLLQMVIPSTLIVSYCSFNIS